MGRRAGTHGEGLGRARGGPAGAGGALRLRSRMPTHRAPHAAASPGAVCCALPIIFAPSPPAHLSPSGPSLYSDSGTCSRRLLLRSCNQWINE